MFGVSVCRAPNWWDFATDFCIVCEEVTLYMAIISHDFFLLFSSDGPLNRQPRS